MTQTITVRTAGTGADDPVEGAVPGDGALPPTPGRPRRATGSDSDDTDLVEDLITGGDEDADRPDADRSRHRATRDQQPRGRWGRPLLSLVVLLAGLPLLALPSRGPGQLLEAAGVVAGRFDARTVGALVLVVLWVLWLQLASCALVESVSAVRGAGLPRRVPYATPRQQAYVRRQVTAIVLAAQADRGFHPTRYRLHRFRRPAAGPEPDGGPAAVATSGVEALRRRHRPPLPRRDVIEAGLLSAGLLDALAALRRRTEEGRAVGAPVVHPDPEAAEVEVAARIGADAASAELLDRSLRWVAGALLASGRPPLRLLAARLGTGYLDLLVTEPRADLPVPLEPMDQGSRWRLPLDVQLPEVQGVPAPAPALVCLGHDGAGRVLVDLEQCQGVVSVAGDRNGARSVVATLALELVTARWSDDVRVTLVGFGRQVEALGGRRLRCADRLGEVLEEVTDRLSAHRQRSGADPGAARTPEIVVLAAPPPAEELDELTAWFLDPPARAPLVVLVAGEVPDAAWPFTLGRDGVLDTGPLAHPVGAQAVSARTFAALGRLVRAAAGDTGAGTDDGDGDGDGDGGEPAADRQPVDPAGIRVLVHLFGPPAVTGDVGPGSDLAVEITAYLALCGPATPAELAAALWPGGVSDAGRNDAIRRTRWWLGLDAAGQPRLRDEDGLLTLSPEVQVDWALYAAAADPLPVLGLLRGEPATPVPPGRYGWLARERLSREIGPLVADGCARTVVELSGQERLEDAVAVLAAGFRACPRSGPLWAAAEVLAGPEARAAQDASRGRDRY